MRKKCKRPLTFLLALLLFFSLTGASVQAEESTKAGSSDKAQTVVIQEDSTQKEDDVEKLLPRKKTCNTMHKR